MTTQLDRRLIFGTQLREIRTSKGLSQADLADQIHISATSINRYEQGLREPDFDTLGLLVNFFGVDFNYFLRQPGEFSPLPESDLVRKFHALDDRGKASVLNMLEHEYSFVNVK